ncbi:MAG: outer membrane beta-barrel protein [Rhodothermales bacterium]
MHRAFFALVVLLLAPGVLAQDSAPHKGSLLLEGSVGYASLGGTLYATLAQDRYGVWEVTPEVKYFVTPHIALGALIQFNRVSYDDRASTEALTIGPTASYYFDRVGGRTLPFVSGGIAFSTMEYVFPHIGNPDIAQPTVSGSGFSGHLSGGVAYAMTNAVLLAGTVLYERFWYTLDNEAGDLSANKLGVRLGIAYSL